VQAWVIKEPFEGDQREEHKYSPNQEVSLSRLADLRVLYWRIECDSWEKSAELAKIRADRGYKNHDIINITRETLPNYDDKLKIFFSEHLHEDEEIRYVLDGTGYFDIRDETDKWIRIAVEKGDMIVLPAGMYHRFTLDSKNYIKALRLFQDAPKWIALNRDVSLNTLAARQQYKGWVESQMEDKRKKRKREEKEDIGNTTSVSASAQMNGVKQSSGGGGGGGGGDGGVVITHGVNGTGYILKEGAKAIANYPHMRKAGGLLYVSGTSSRRADNTHAGATQNKDGTWNLDIREQTRAVIQNIQRVLKEAGADLGHLIDVTTYLTDMKHYSGYNEVYNTFFNAETGPTRTTIAVHQLPHPNLLIEIKAVAVDPAASSSKL